ncbi:MAG: MbcA/ParS/Xre antitoxin family protein [Alphaproteobacteria bacterium]|nr:MbcA/ParS/Xre antitoxin family protein [Alphaproteobacteria bacterium]
MTARSYGRIVALAVRAFDDVDEADTYLRSPKQFLNGRTPLEAARTPEGAALVERQLYWISQLISGPTELRA